MGLSDIMSENVGLANSLNQAVGGNESAAPAGDPVPNEGDAPEGDPLSDEEFSQYVDEDGAGSEEDDDYYEEVEDRATEELGDKYIDGLKEDMDDNEFRAWLEEYDRMEEE